MIVQIGPGLEIDPGKAAKNGVLKSYLEAVEAIEKQCFSDPWTLPMIEESMGTGLDVYLLLVEDGETAAGSLTADAVISPVSGYCVFRVIAGEGELFRIAVTPGCRGLGYGKKLMDGMVDYSRKNGVSAITLEVRESNLAARNLYKSYDFKEESIRKNYYRSPVEDAVIMWKYEI